jgi:hypothetical protein
MEGNRTTARPRRPRGLGRWSLFGTAPAAALAVLIVTAPVSIASSKTVLTAPYAHTSFFTSHNPDAQGCWSESLTAPHWNGTTGKGGTNMGASTTSCQTYGATANNDSSTTDILGVSINIPLPAGFHGGGGFYVNWSFNGVGNLSIVPGQCAPTVAASSCSVSTGWFVGATACVEDTTTGGLCLALNSGSYSNHASKSNVTSCSADLCTSKLSSGRGGHWGHVSLYNILGFNGTHRYVVEVSIKVECDTDISFSGTVLTGASASSRVTLSSSTKYWQLDSITLL